MSPLVNALQQCSMFALTKGTFLPTFPLLKTLVLWLLTSLALLISESHNFLSPSLLPRSNSHSILDLPILHSTLLLFSEDGHHDNIFNIVIYLFLTWLLHQDVMCEGRARLSLGIHLCVLSTFNNTCHLPGLWVCKCSLLHSSITVFKKGFHDKTRHFYVSIYVKKSLRPWDFYPSNISRSLAYAQLLTMWTGPHDSSCISTYFFLIVNSHYKSQTKFL